MISVLLTILKLLGVLLLLLLGILFFLLLLVLFVPVRYAVVVRRETESGQAFILKLKATWLLHFLNVHFAYPEEAYIRVRLLCVTVFCSDKEKKPSKEKPDKESFDLPSLESEKIQTEDIQSEKVQSERFKDKAEAETKSNEMQDSIPQKPEKKENSDDQGLEHEKMPSVRNFFKKLFSLLKNLRYTIEQICDKIKKIVKNIKYYIGILNSDELKKSFHLCSSQIGILLRHIRPQKVKGNLLIGTGDPASTGQVLAICGMLYPFWGSQIAVTADFEQRIVEGELSIKGRITLFRLIRCAWVVYFNKDLRRLIKMLKREAK